MPLSRVRAVTRREVVHALYIFTAQDFQRVFRHGPSPDKAKSFDEFARGTGGTAMRVITSFLPDAELELIANMPNPFDCRPEKRLDLSDRQQIENSLAFIKESERLSDITMNDGLMRETETIDSFVSFLKTLNPAARDYWSCIYQRMGIPCPLGV